MARRGGGGWAVLVLAPALALAQPTAANKKLAEAAGRCDAPQVTALLEQRAGPASAGVEEAFAAGMEAKAGSPKARACAEVLKALLARGASGDKTRGEGSLLEEAKGAERGDLAGVLAEGGAMTCEKAAGVLEGTDEAARAFAIKVVLPRCGEPGAVALAALLTHHDDDLKREAVVGLMRHGPKASAAVPELTSLMNSGESELALCAAEALARIQRPPAAAVEAHLVKRLGKGEPEQVNRALQALSAGGLGATANAGQLLKFVSQRDDPARSGAALEILIAQAVVFAARVPPLEKRCKGAAQDCRTDPCTFAGDFDGNGKLDAARLFEQPGQGEPGVAFVLDSGACVKWEAGAEAFTSWRLELAPDKKGTALAISGGKAGDALLFVRDGKPRVDAAP